MFLRTGESAQWLSDLLLFPRNWVWVLAPRGQVPTTASRAHHPLLTHKMFTWLCFLCVHTPSSPSSLFGFQIGVILIIIEIVLPLKSSRCSLNYSHCAQRALLGRRNAGGVTLTLTNTALRNSCAHNFTIKCKLWKCKILVLPIIVSFIPETVSS